MKKIIAICNTENIYVKETENGYFKWYDSVSESTDDFDTIEDARRNFIEFMKTENPEVFIKEIK